MKTNFTFQSIWLIGLILLRSIIMQWLLDTMMLRHFTGMRFL